VILIVATVAVAAETPAPRPDTPLANVLAPRADTPAAPADTPGPLADTSAPPADPAPLADSPAPPADTSAPPAPIARIGEGDLAWWRGDRGAAVAAWKDALATVRGDPAATSRAAEAMARVRLLQFSGSIGPFVHEGPLDRALADCPASEPWCAIAEADWNLWMPAFTGADPTRVAAVVRDSPLVGPALARRVVAGEDPALLAGHDDLDGMGRGIRETGKARPWSPGTWSLGIGVGGAAGEGVAGIVRFSHPDVAWRAHRVDLAASLDTRGGGALATTLTTASRWQFSASGARQVGDLVVGDERSTYALGSVRGGVAWLPRGQGWSGQIGLGARTDTLGAEWMPVAGPFGSAAISDGTVWSRVSVETGFGAYTHVGFGWDTRGFPKVGGGVFAWRVAYFGVPTPESPFFRLPSAGGSEVLRGVPAGRWRDESMFAAQAEYRRTFWDPLGFDVFVDTADVEGWHATAGGGLRLTLPGNQVTRVEVGWCPESWGVVAGWGDAF
jgi:hypothetical protein